VTEEGPKRALGVREGLSRKVTGTGAETPRYYCLVLLPGMGAAKPRIIRAFP